MTAGEAGKFNAVHASITYEAPAAARAFHDPTSSQPYERFAIREAQPDASRLAASRARGLDG